LLLFNNFLAFHSLHGINVLPWIFNTYNMFLKFPLCQSNATLDNVIARFPYATLFLPPELFNHIPQGSGSGSTSIGNSIGNYIFLHNVVPGEISLASHGLLQARYL